MPSLALSSFNKGLKGDTGATGATGPAGAGAVGVWSPSESGVLAAPFDPILATSSGLMSAGILYFSKVKVSTTGPITFAHFMGRSPAGAGLANTYVGIYTVDATTATLLAQTNDVSTQAQGANDQKVALSAPTASITAGATLLIAFLVGTATTAPTLRVTGAGGGNTNLTATSPYRFGTFGTGLTALPATFALSSSQSGATFTWLGLS